MKDFFDGVPLTTRSRRSPSAIPTSFLWWMRSMATMCRMSSIMNIRFCQLLHIIYRQIK